MTDLAATDTRLRALLPLERAPVAVSFCGEAPAGVPPFRGQTPSGCTFWRLAAERPAGRSAFTTAPPDHHGCPIGSYTHGLDLPPERAGELTDMLGLMDRIGYVSPEEVPGIPRWPRASAAVVYAQLADAPVAPDAVIFALRPRAAMLLDEAARRAGVSAGLEPLPRPTCMAIPAAAQRGTTLSLGCIGNRVYTELDDGLLYMVVRGSDLDPLVTALETISAANRQLEEFHRTRKPALTR